MSTVAFPVEREDLKGQDNYVTYDDDECMGKTAPDAKSLVYVSDKKFGQYKMGTPTVFMFWAEYSKPTYKFLTLFSTLQAKYESKVLIVGVSTDPTVEYPKRVLETEFAKAWKTDFALAHDDGKVMKEAYAAITDDTISLPHSFLVDTKGIIVWHQDHSELGATVPNYMHLLEKQIDALLKTGEVEKIGERPVVEDDGDEGEEALEGDDFSLF